MKTRMKNPNAKKLAKASLWALRYKSNCNFIENNPGDEKERMKILLHSLIIDLMVGLVGVWER